MKTKILLSIVFLSLLIACGTQTKITGIWRIENYKAEDFSKIAVIAISSDINQRDIIEDALVIKLKEIGYNAVPGSAILTPDMLKIKDKKLLEKELKKNSIDGALAISLLDIKEDSYFVEDGREYYQPMGMHYYSFYDYYYYNYDRVYTPGYYETVEEVFLESNFYSLISDTLIQTIQSETIDPADVKDLARSYSNALVEQLVIGRVLKNKALIEERKAKEEK